MKFFVNKIIVNVLDLKQAVAYYARIFVQEGDKVDAKTHFFTLGDTLFYCIENKETVNSILPHVGIACNDLETLFTRVKLLDNISISNKIEENDLDERFFEITDPCQNKIVFYDSNAVFYGLNP